MFLEHVWSGLAMHAGDTCPSPQEAHSSRHVCVLSRIPL